MNTASSSLSLNQLLAPAAHTQAAQQFRTQDANIRTEAARKAAAAGADATVVTSLKYSVGPDGQLYATDATISTTRRVRGNPLSSELAPYNSNSASDSTPRQPAPNRQARFGDFLPPQVAYSPLEMALLQESRDNPLAAKELAQIDAGVRTHERQHYFTAGGLVSGLPEYDYAIGPDGQLYAVGGHVDVSTTPTRDPEKAARDGAALARAATAPGDTSAQDIGAARSSISNAASLYSKASNLRESSLLSMVA